MSEQGWSVPVPAHRLVDLLMIQKVPSSGLLVCSGNARAAGVAPQPSSPSSLSPSPQSRSTLQGQRQDASNLTVQTMQQTLSIQHHMEQPSPSHKLVPARPTVRFDKEASSSPEGPSGAIGRTRPWQQPHGIYHTPQDPVRGSSGTLGTGSQVQDAQQQKRAELQVTSLAL